MSTAKRRYKPPKPDDDTFATQEEFLDSLVPVPLESVSEVNRRCTYCWKQYGESDEGYDNAEVPVKFRCNHTFGEKCMKELFSLPETVEFVLRPIDPTFPTGSHEAMLVQGLQRFLNYYAEAYARKKALDITKVKAVETPVPLDPKIPTPPQEQQSPQQPVPYPEPLDTSVAPDKTSDIFALLLTYVQRNQLAHYLRDWSMLLMHLLSTHHKIARVHFHSNGISYDTDDQEVLEPISYPKTHYVVGSFAPTTPAYSNPPPIGTFEFLVNHMAPPIVGLPVANAVVDSAEDSLPPSSNSSTYDSVSGVNAAATPTSTHHSTESTTTTPAGAATVAISVPVDQDTAMVPAGSNNTPLSESLPPMALTSHQTTQPAGTVIAPSGTPLSTTAHTEPHTYAAVETEETAQKIREYQMAMSARHKEISRRITERIECVASALTTLYAQYTDMVSQQPEFSRRKLPADELFSYPNIALLDTKTTVHNNKYETTHFHVSAPYGAMPPPPVYDSEDEQNENSDSPQLEQTRMIIFRRSLCENCIPAAKDRVAIRSTLPVPKSVSWKNVKKVPDSCPICAKILFQKPQQ